MMCAPGRLTEKYPLCGTNSDSFLKWLRQQEGATGRHARSLGHTVCNRMLRIAE